jgi:hypothetical protein
VVQGEGKVVCSEVCVCVVQVREKLCAVTCVCGTG